MSTAAVVPSPPPQQELQKKATFWVDLARSLQVTTPFEYEMAAEHLKTIKALGDEVDNTFDPIIKKAHEAHAEALAQKRKVRDPLTLAEGIIKSGMGAFTDEEKRKSQEDARLRRQEQERIAAEEREREIIEAETAGVSAEEVKVITEAPLRMAPIVSTPYIPRVSGIAPRENWKYEVTNKLLLDQFIAKNPQFSNLTSPNSAAIGGIVRSLKAATNIPGVKVWSESNISSRRS